MTDAPLVRRSPVPPDQCNLWKAFGLIGDRWTLVILRSALYGVRRFDDFQLELEIPRSVLSNRLAGLVELGIMERREYREDGQRARIEYPLTEMGRALGLPFHGHDRMERPLDRQRHVATDVAIEGVRSTV